MERTGKLNDRQAETLRLIGSGSDLSDDEHVKLRITARALESRGLVSISRRTGRWRATLTDAGRHYLEHGGHPDAVDEPPTDRTGSRKRRAPGTGSRVVPDQREKSEPRKVRPATRDERRGDAVALIERLEQERTVNLFHLSETEYSRWRKTIDYAKRHGLVPDGHSIERNKTVRDGMSIRLVSAIHPNATRKSAVGLPPVPVPGRLHRPHPVVSRLRDGDDQLAMPKDLRRRSLLLLQAIVTAALERGWKVSNRPKEQRAHRTYHQRVHGRHEGVVCIGIDGFTYEVTIDQEFPQSANPVKAQTLKIELPYARASGRRVWADRKTAALDDRLPEILEGLADRAVEDRERVIAEEREKAERRRRWEAAMSRAEERAIEHHYAEILDGQAQAFERSRRLGRYCDRLEQRIADDDSGSPEAASATAWLAWARTYAESLDPFGTLPTMPAAPEFGPRDLEPFLDGWSPYGPEGRRNRW